MVKASELSIVPQPMGIVSRKGRNNDLNITNMSVGNI